MTRFCLIPDSSRHSAMTSDRLIFTFLSSHSSCFSMLSSLPFTPCNHSPLPHLCTPCNSSPLSHSCLLFTICNCYQIREVSLPVNPLQVPEECPAEVGALIQQCLEKEVAQRPSAKQVYSTMMGVLQGEGGLPDEPVRVVNTDSAWGSSPSSSAATDTTYDSVGSKPPPGSNGNTMSTVA